MISDHTAEQKIRATIMRMLPSDLGMSCIPGLLVFVLYIVLAGIHIYVPYLVYVVLVSFAAKSIRDSTCALHRSDVDETATEGPEEIPTNCRAVFAITTVIMGIVGYWAATVIDEYL